MRKLFQLLMGFVLLFMAFGCGANNTTEIPTLTNTSLPTQTPTVTSTSTPKPTNIPIPTPSPIYVTLGSPFPSDCGDGITRIWSNDNFNAPFDLSKIDDHHGHHDDFPPVGCDVGNMQGEFIAPATGYGEMYGNGQGYHLFLPKNVFPVGIVDALRFAGIENPDLSKISQIIIDIGHVTVPKDGNVNKGDSIGDLVELPPQISHRYKIGYQVFVVYAGVEYALSPTLFQQDGPKWTCVVGSPYDCEPEPHDYAP